MHRQGKGHESVSASYTACIVMPWRETDGRKRQVDPPFGDNETIIKTSLSQGALRA